MPACESAQMLIKKWQGAQASYCKSSNGRSCVQVQADSHSSHAIDQVRRLTFTALNRVVVGGTGRAFKSCCMTDMYRVGGPAERSGGSLVGPRVYSDCHSKEYSSTLLV